MNSWSTIVVELRTRMRRNWVRLGQEARGREHRNHQRQGKF